jgi:hypothetical protein
MQTQQQGTDISGDVSFEVDGDTPAIITPVLYQFKATVTRIALGQYRVRIAAGEGIDQAHAEIVVWQGAVLSQNGAPTTNLLWRVVQIASTAAGEIQYDVFFEAQSTVPPADDAPLTLAGRDPVHASITIRRKVPSVN